MRILLHIHMSAKQVCNLTVSRAAKIYKANRKMSPIWPSRNIFLSRHAWYDYPIGASRDWQSVCPPHTLPHHAFLEHPDTLIDLERFYPPMTGTNKSSIAELHRFSLLLDLKRSNQSHPRLSHAIGEHNKLIWYGPCTFCTTKEFQSSRTEPETRSRRDIKFSSRRWQPSSR